MKAPLIYFFKTKSRLKRLRDNLIKAAAQKWLLSGGAPPEAISRACYFQSKQKQNIVNSVKPSKKVVFFVFRDMHLIDWFIPIHKALSKKVGDQTVVFYIDFGHTLKNVRSGFNYLPYKREIERRLFDSGISPLFHFSSQEIHLYTDFPEPRLIVTSETIRQENFTARDRVYLPHYCLPKAKDKTLPDNIRHNHIFLPSKPPYTYNDLEKSAARLSVTVHKTGYPKIHAPASSGVKLFDSSNPLAIYAPSLEFKIVLGYVKRGLIDIFKKMTGLNFVIKLHPTLSSPMRYIKYLIERKTASSSHIICDSKTNIQQIGAESSLMITDFGSIGGEYRLSFGKRVVYLETPLHLKGGADLRFRDDFADGIADLSNLESVVKRALSKGNLSEEERKEMAGKTLFAYGKADERAAESIFRIINDHAESRKTL